MFKLTLFVFFWVCLYKHAFADKTAEMADIYACVVLGACILDDKIRGTGIKN